LEFLNRSQWKLVTGLIDRLGERKQWRVQQNQGHGRIASGILDPFQLWLFAIVPIPWTVLLYQMERRFARAALRATAS